MEEKITSRRNHLLGEEAKFLEILNVTYLSAQIICRARGRSAVMTQHRKPHETVFSRSSLPIPLNEQ